MNRIYIASYDGRIFFADQNSTTFELLEYSDSNKYVTSVKRLSACDWCLWVVSSHYGLYVYPFKLDTPIEHVEVTYENQVFFVKIKNKTRVNTKLILNLLK
jgi:hypothetical protein